jgi:hypothetical protein
LRWQIDEIKKAIREADRNEFASTDDVHKVLKKWNSKRVRRNSAGDQSHLPADSDPPFLIECP